MMTFDNGAEDWGTGEVLLVLMVFGMHMFGLCIHVRVRIRISFKDKNHIVQLKVQHESIKFFFEFIFTHSPFFVFKIKLHMFTKC